MANRNTPVVSDSLDRTIQKILEQSQAMTGAACSYVATLRGNDTKESVVTSLDAGGVFRSAINFDVPFETCPLQTRCHSKTALEAGDSERDRPWLELFDLRATTSICNALLVPFVVNGEVVGLLGLANKEKGFTDRDIDMASSFGEYAAMALCDARSADRVRTTVGQLRQTLERRQPQSTLITVCAMCKKVRSDDGSWHLLAAVVGDGDDLSVSHGLCESCARVFFGQPIESATTECHLRASSPDGQPHITKP